MNRLFVTAFLVWGVFVYGQGVSHVRYYRNEDDFVKGLEMLATERTGVAHLQVLFDRQEKVLSKATLDAAGIVVEEEVYDYDAEGNLAKRAVRDARGHTQKLFVYGDDEEMSRIFIAYVFPGRDPRDFRDRVTIYDYRPDGDIKGYRFLTVDNTEFGRISYDYFESGLMAEEKWENSLAGTVVRLFQYQYDSESGRYEMTEYDSTGSPISHVGLVLPLDITLPDVGGGAVLPERGDTLAPSANVLEESSDIIRDILKRKAEGWDPATELGPLFQKDVLNSPDIIYLKNGDTLEVDLLQISDDFVRCFFFGENEILSIPLSSVGEIERRDGKIVYPVVY